MKSAWTDKSTRVLLAIIAVLLAANLASNLPGGGTTRALAAGVPDTAAQTERIIDELTKLNKNVEGLQSFLESGKLTVKMDKTDKTDK